MLHLSLTTRTFIIILLLGGVLGMSVPTERGKLVEHAKERAVFHRAFADYGAGESPQEKWHRAAADTYVGLGADLTSCEEKNGGSWVQFKCADVFDKYVDFHKDVIDKMFNSNYKTLPGDS